MPQGTVIAMAGFTGVGGSVGDADSPRPVLQFTTEDGRAMEVGSPVPASKRRPLADGSHMLVRYDPTIPASWCCTDTNARPGSTRWRAWAPPSFW